MDMEYNFNIIIVFRVNKHIKSNQRFSQGQTHAIMDNGSSYPKLEMTGSSFGPKKCHL